MEKVDSVYLLVINLIYYVKINKFYIALTENEILRVLDLSSN